MSTVEREECGGYAEAMDLRDHFAGLAMQVVLADRMERGDTVATKAEVADHAYLMADAMIERRKQ